MGQTNFYNRNYQMGWDGEWVPNREWADPDSAYWQSQADDLCRWIDDKIGEAARCIWAASIETHTVTYRQWAEAMLNKWRELNPPTPRRTAEPAAGYAG